jgi:predicted TIM-barrel fold metal-dependent hydrolase
MSGYHLLARYQLSYDNYSPDVDRLEALARLARANSEIPVVVNHLGGTVDPSANVEEVSRWKTAVDAVAACPNAVMKCGGAQMRVGDWEPPFHMNVRPTPIGSEELCDLLFPYYEYAIGAFGPERCMFESNFPVDRECVSYRTLWNTFKRIAARLGLSEAEKASIFHDTAARIYRI